MGFKLMNDHIFEVDTTPTAEAPTWARVAAGIKNVSPGTNEEVDQTAYLDAQVGFKESDVVGAQLVLTFTADRKYDDDAQNYIFSLLLELGPNRRTKFRQKEPDGGIFEGPVTIANITPPGGDAGAKGECSFEVHFNGKPTYTPPALPEIPEETEVLENDHNEMRD